MESTQKINIGYLYNPDKVYYSQMDDQIIQRLKDNGAEVIPFKLDDISFSVTRGNVDILLRNEKINLDGFLSYGYMSEFHYEAYLYIVYTMDSINISCLHTPEAEKILNNKYLQSLCYSKKSLLIPLTQIGFSIESFKSMANTYFPRSSILKKLDDYGGDGVSHHPNKDNLINNAAKLLWKNEYCLFQEFIKDSIGRSIRVLCIDGKAVACAEYIDKTSNFKSNSSYGFEFFSLESLMDSPKLNDYFELAEKAVASIGNLTIGGVDILDSKEKGPVVLEVNGWPDIYDIAQATNIDIFNLFAKAFYKKVVENKEKKTKANI